MHGINDENSLDNIAEDSLTASFLWDEVKDRLNESAFTLSGGQQQRLCISRTLAVKPEVILFDEPCSGLDPISTAKVEDAMVELKEKYNSLELVNKLYNFWLKHCSIVAFLWIIAPCKMVRNNLLIFICRPLLILW